MRVGHVDPEPVHRRFRLGCVPGSLAVGVLGVGGTLIGGVSSGLGGGNRGSGLVQLLGQPTYLVFVNRRCLGGQQVSVVEL